MSQTRIKHRLQPLEVLEFSEDSWTERGERVWKTLKITCHIEGLPEPIERVLACSPELGITEPFIEDTVAGALAALARDYPHAIFEVERPVPNHIVLRWAGVRPAEVN